MPNIRPRAPFKALRVEKARRASLTRYNPPAGAGSHRAAPAATTEAQRAAVADLVASAEALPSKRSRRVLSRYAGEAQRVSDTGNRLVAECAPHGLQRVEGFRIVDVGFVDKALASLLTCPHCHAIGTLICSREHEVPYGLCSSLAWMCTACGEQALRTATSRPLPRKAEQKGPSLRQINAQLVTAAVHTGLGREQSRLLSSILDIPAPSKKCWGLAASVVYPAMEESGHDSARAALVEERVEALAEGVLPDAKGETPIVISIDARWPKRGRANNSLDGYMAAIGERSGKVVDFAYRTKVGKRKNWSRSSKAMEPSMGCEIVERLNADPNGAYVDGLCMDLDSATRAHVRELCEERGWPEPRTLHDLNHFIKCVKGAMIVIKKDFKARFTFTAETQLRLASQLALMIHQQRTSYQSVSDLEASLLQVVNHAFNDHSNCRQWFSCPCCGANPRTASNYNKDGAWLSERGGAPLKARLVALVKKMCADHGAGLMHLASTQGNEALNGMSVRMTPKSLVVAFSDAGPARQAASVKRYNDGLQAAVHDIFKRVGAHTSRISVQALRVADNTRHASAIRKASRSGKRKRKCAKTTLKERVQTEEQDGDDTAYASGMAF